MGLVKNGLGLLACVALLTGCVNRGTYDELADTQRTTVERNEAMRADLANRDNEVKVLRDQLTRSESLSSDLRGTVERLRDQLAAAEQSLLAFGERLGQAQVVALDPETDRALARLASQNPNLIRYDSARGMLRFASDLTFDSGQDVVKGDAKQSLAALADVLKSASATVYEVHIVGHTDSQAISAGTAQRGHPTNTHLSCHRAIAVRRELTSLGVAADRLMAAGWGETRPAVPNTANGNTPANRRVEIFLTRPTGTSAGNAPTGTANPDNEAPPSRPIDVTK